jgi:hypothetical protein
MKGSGMSAQLQIVPPSMGHHQSTFIMNRNVNCQCPHVDEPLPGNRLGRAKEDLVCNDDFGQVYLHIPADQVLTYIMMF